MTKALVSTDTHSFAEPEHFRIRNVDLDLEVSFDRRQLGGIAILSIERLSANSDSLVLDTRDLAVTAVAGSEDGGAFSKRNWHLGPRDSLLGSALIIQVTPRDRFVSIAYSTSPDASGLQWLEPSFEALSVPLHAIAGNPCAKLDPFAGHSKRTCDIFGKDHCASAPPPGNGGRFLFRDSAGR